MKKLDKEFKKTNNDSQTTMEPNKNDSISNFTQGDASDDKKENEQLSKCTDESLLEKSRDKESNPCVEAEDDLLLKTGEYYHDSENYPINVRFKHPFMNIISLICGILSSICCVCASPTPLFKLHLIYIVPAFLFSMIGTGLFIFDLIKSKTVNGLSISGLIVSILGGILSIINITIIGIAFVVFDIFPAVATFFGTVASSIVGVILAIFI